MIKTTNLNKIQYLKTIYNAWDIPRDIQIPISNTFTSLDLAFLKLEFPTEWKQEYLREDK
jgi:hypothetical protein